MIFSTSPLAASTRMPVGLPAIISTRPPEGVGVCASILPSLSARLVARPVELLYLAVVAHQHRREAHQVPPFVDRITVDVVDQHIGRGGGKGEERGDGRREGSEAHGRAIRLVSRGNQME